MPSSLNGTGVTFNDGSTLQSGNIPSANLGSGTANSSTFLRGDRTFAAPPSVAPTTAQVLSATAGASAGAVGTYAFLGLLTTDNTQYIAGTTYAGSSLRFAGNGISAIRAGGATPAGTWRAMGTQNSPNTSGYQVVAATLFLRIS